ncbi:hypothetical protein IEO70_12930 [Bacillus sp. AGMB 02131]|uniref:Uncharacterized protein n=1 Tax=Peribacillus faecalis TaxID=2772559 RepID=A0A927HC66_9BACI|nr:hypothetical protein [Peribacillus faecalis]MBD3109251.1 hypothetical protein [Peribacillus faecalis]
MLKFIDDLAGAVHDIFKCIFTGLCYFVAGMLIIGIPLALAVIAVQYIFER